MYLPKITIYTSWYVDKIRPALRESEKTKACVIQRCTNDEIKYFTIDILGESIQNLEDELKKKLNNSATEVGIVWFSADKTLNEQVFHALGNATESINAICVGGYFCNGRVATFMLMSRSNET